MLSKKILHTTLCLLSFLVLNNLNAQVSWDGQAGTNNWHDALNWDTDQVPTSADDVILAANVVEVPFMTTANARSISMVDNSLLMISPVATLNLANASGFALSMSESTLMVDGQLNIANVSSGIDVKNNFSLILISGTLNIDHYNGTAIQFDSSCSGCLVDNQGLLFIDNGGIGSTAAVAFVNSNSSKLSNSGTVEIGNSSNGGGGISFGLFGGEIDNAGNISIMATGSSKPGVSSGFFPGTLNNMSSGMITFGSGIDGTAPIGGFNLNLTNNGTIDFDKGGSVDVVLSGSGTVGGMMPMNNVNSISPGNSPGCLTFASGLTHSGLTNIEIGGTTGCTNHDKVDVTGTANISGAVNVSLINGFTPVAGQTFTLLEADVISGTYSAINYPTVSGITWQTQYNATSVVAKANAALPVELIKFNARTVNQHVALDWATATERNNAGFYVEKSSDSKAWERIEFIEGAGDAVVQNTYTMVDKNPFAGINYYRLQQVDRDGTSEYSEIVSANITYQKQVSIYPNPASDILNLKGEQLENSIVRILNSAGIPVHRQVYEGEVIDIQHLQAGIYMIEIAGKGDPIYERLIIK